MLAVVLILSLVFISGCIDEAKVPKVGQEFDLYSVQQVPDKEFGTYYIVQFVYPDGQIHGLDGYMGHSCANNVFETVRGESSKLIYLGRAESSTASFCEDLRWRLVLNATTKIIS